jgi:hypothetical protein
MLKNWFAAAGALIVTLGAIATANAATPAFKGFIGINGHTVQFKPDLYQPIGSLVRDYHPVEWDLGNNSTFVAKFPFARNGVHWESVYGSWKKKGWRVNASLMFESMKREDWKDVARDARAYGEAFAKAFGPTSGSGLVESVEIGNEPGKWSDADYRVMFENMARGLRAGDPKMKIVTCALAPGKSHDYAKSVECIAGLEDLFDVLSVHSYAELEPWPTWRRSFPEDPKLNRFTKDITEICAWRDARAPGKPVWITEFGYDATTKKPDPKSEFKAWMPVTDLQQAQWLVRSWLYFATLPVDRAYVYFFNDSDEASLHAASGLTRNFIPRPAFYAVAHLQKTLGNYRFKEQANVGDAIIAKFEHVQNPNQRILVAWLPSGEGKSVSIQLPTEYGAIEKIEGMPLRESETITVESRGKALTVTESPTFIFLK